MEFWLNQRSFVYIGGLDLTQTSTPEEMFDYFKRRVANVTRGFFPEGDHSLADCEAKVIDAIVRWLRTEKNP